MGYDLFESDIEFSTKSLAIELAKCNDENEVVEKLKNAGYWDDYKFWHAYGDNENNYSTIGNQQSKADAALVEKLINSVDAVLMKECMVRGIEMSGPDAPQSIKEALRQFFNVFEGQISELDQRTRSKMAESIILAATGSKSQPCLVIADRGEGQTPNKLPGTILSISKNNKLRVPFVQGKYNMGGTGALSFCGERGLQLVISRRCPQIPNSDNDPSFDDWAFTIVRREEPREGRRSSMFTYLTDENGQILRFKADKLDIIPEDVRAYSDMSYGTYLKLYQYDMEHRSGPINLDYNYRLALLLPELGHPIKVKECRDYAGHGNYNILTGITTRLKEAEEKILENGYPSSFEFNVDNQFFQCRLYVFKKDKAANYKFTEGIVYSMNGQTHGLKKQDFFRTKKVDLSYLADSILILVDCSSLDVFHKEKMFMNSRDRLWDNEFTRSVEEEIQKMLKEHPGLKQLQNNRRAAALRDQLEGDKPFKEVLEDIISKSSVLNNLLVTGNRLSNPFNFGQGAGEGKVFEGKKDPSFFKLVNKTKSAVLRKEVPVNHGCQVQFETDAENEFFVRPIDSGELLISCDGERRQDLKRSLTLFNGIATLRMDLPESVCVGDILSIDVNIEQYGFVNDSMKNTLKIKVTEEQEYKSGGNGGRQPSDNTRDGARQRQLDSAMPNIREIHKDRWEEFSMNDESALILRATADGGGDFFINMDNKYLLTELKGIRDHNKVELTKARFKYSIVLIGMSIESYYRKSENQEDSDVAPEDVVKKTTTMIAPILVPLINSMAELEI